MKTYTERFDYQSWEHSAHCAFHKNNLKNSLGRYGKTTDDVCSCGLDKMRLILNECPSNGNILKLTLATERLPTLDEEYSRADRGVRAEHYRTNGNLPQNPEAWDIITFLELGFLDGTAFKYIARWRKQKKEDGIRDVRKAITYLEKLLSEEMSNGR